MVSCLCPADSLVHSLDYSVKWVLWSLVSRLAFLPSVCYLRGVLQIFDVIGVLAICHCLVRHVILPKEIAKSVPKGKILSEMEWRSMGVQQSRGWEHYACHRCRESSRGLATVPLFHVVLFLVRLLRKELV